MQRLLGAVELPEKVLLGNIVSNNGCLNIMSLLYITYGGLRHVLYHFSWLRRRWNSSPVVIVGAEDEEYQLSMDDIDTSLVFMYTPVTEEGVKGEPQCKYTDFIKAGATETFRVSLLFFTFLFFGKWNLTSL